MFYDAESKKTITWTGTEDPNQQETAGSVRTRVIYKHTKNRLNNKTQVGAGQSLTHPAGTKKDTHKGSIKSRK